ncbi:MAG: hypothetical protein QY323_06175 [Patescibacteria group bacterium]|nr:MAG: hypothetical protein QY323_06175 [Patescibacteria group bacterium]
MPKLVKATLVMSDHHLGEGKPKLEDFPAENEKAYLEMLKAHLELIGPDVSYCHVIGGDWLDYHVVEFEGRYGVFPTEEAALAKTEAIMQAHASYFAGLRSLAEAFPQMFFEIVPGNHDLDLKWPSVQEVIRAALVPPEEGRRVAFPNEVRIAETVLFCHGDQFDPFSANPPEHDTIKEDVMISRKVMLLMLLLSLVLAGALAGFTFSLLPYTLAGVGVGVIVSFVVLFLMFRWIAGHLAFRWGRTKTVLNVPIASHMNAGLGTRLKKWIFHGIGRRVDHGDEWILGVARKWYVLPILLPMVALETLALKFFYLFRRPREKFNPRLMLDLIASTTHADRIEKGLAAFLEERPGVCHLIAGHTHDGKMETVEIDGRTVIYYNSGTAIRQMRTYKPEVRAVTAWPKLETFFRRVLYYWIHAPFGAAASTMAYLAVPVALFLLPEMPFLTALRWPVAFGAVFLLLWWQFAAEYRDGHFFRFTPPEVLEYDDGSVRVRILQYDHDAGRFQLVTGEEATWDHYVEGSVN